MYNNNNYGNPNNNISKEDFMKKGLEIGQTKDVNKVNELLGTLTPSDAQYLKEHFVREAQMNGQRMNPEQLASLESFVSIFDRIIAGKR